MIIFSLQINLIAPPVYVVTTTTLERELGIETLKKAINAIEDSITASKGQFSVKMEVINSFKAFKKAPKFSSFVNAFSTNFQLNIFL